MASISWAPRMVAGSIPVLWSLVASVAIAQPPPPPPPPAPPSADVATSPDMPPPPPTPVDQPPAPEVPQTGETIPAANTGVAGPESGEQLAPPANGDAPPAAGTTGEPVVPDSTTPAATEEPAATQEEASDPTSGSEEESSGVVESSRFIKGDLIHVGTRRLLSRFDHVGVAVGPYILDSDLFLTITPGAAFYTDSFAFSFGVPLNLLLYEGGTRELANFKVRREDWDEISDYARVVRFFTIGRKEANLYFTLNSLRPASIGHGMLLNNYQGNIDVDRAMTGVIFDAYGKYGGFELQANDVTFGNQILGGLFFVKPLSFVSDSVLAQSLSIGAEYVADTHAPTCVRVAKGGGECLRGVGHQAGFDPFTGENLDSTFIRSDPDTGRFAVKETTVQAAGISGELKVYKDESTADIKLYTTYHQYLNTGGGSGVAAGVLGRFNLGSSIVNALRLRGEYRNFGAGFAPSYFDSLYEIQKYQYATSSNPYQVTPTKYQAVFGDPDNGFARPDHERRHGMNLEASWGIFSGGRDKKQLAFGVGLQDSTAADDTHFYAHLEFPFLGFLQLFGSYIRVSAPDLAAVFEAESFKADNTVVLAGLRLQILPILFLNAHYSRNFNVVRTAGSEYHLGNNSVVDGQGNPSPYFQQDQLFENVQTLFVELELGWEFDDE